MKKLLFILIITISISAKAQNSKPDTLQLEKGLEYIQFDAPVKSFIGDSKISILKISPQYFSFELITASENSDSSYKMNEWIDNRGYLAGINAGMFDLLSNENIGYMQNYDHFNNVSLNPNCGAIAAFNQIDSAVPPFQIIDINCQDWELMSTKYNTYVQAMRLTDCNAKPIPWNVQKELKSSIVALGADLEGNALFIFVRSPYSANDFIKNILSLPLSLKNMMYLEGGHLSAMYINHPKLKTLKLGSYETDVFEDYDNPKAFEIPNVIAVRRK